MSRHGKGANAIPMAGLNPIMARRAERERLKAMGLDPDSASAPAPHSSSSSAYAPPPPPSSTRSSGSEPPRRSRFDQPPALTLPQPGDDGSTADGSRKRARRSRWGDSAQNNPISALATMPPNLDKQQQEAFLLHVEIEDLTRRLRTGDLFSGSERRSPSPEPVYSHDGKRLNTREVRQRQKLELRRHELVQKAMAINSNYKPPSDYRPPEVKIEDRVPIPQGVLLF